MVNFVKIFEKNVSTRMGRSFVRVSRSRDIPPISGLDGWRKGEKEKPLKAATFSYKMIILVVVIPERFCLVGIRRKNQ